MQYFIGYQLKGPASEWVASTSKTLSSTFSTEDPGSKAPPHITIVRPFETNDISSVTEAIRSVLKQSHNGTFLLHGFDTFDSRVLFVKVTPDMGAEQTSKAIRDAIDSLPGMPKPEFETWHPHVTIANHIPQSIATDVWSYSEKMRVPEFTEKFDAVTVYVRSNSGAWSTCDSIQI